MNCDTTDAKFCHECLRPSRYLPAIARQSSHSGGKMVGHKKANLNKSASLTLSDRGMSTFRILARGSLMRFVLTAIMPFLAQLIPKIGTRAAEMMRPVAFGEKAFRHAWPKAK